MSWGAVIEASTAGDRPALMKALDGQPVAVVNASDGIRRTALSWASANGHISCVQLLLSRTADPMRKDNYGYTALHEATSFGHDRVVQVLLDGRANPNAVNNVGEGAIQ